MCGYHLYRYDLSHLFLDCLVSEQLRRVIFDSSLSLIFSQTLGRARQLNFLWSYFAHPFLSLERDRVAL